MKCFRKKERNKAATTKKIERKSNRMSVSTMNVLVVLNKFYFSENNKIESTQKNIVTTVRFEESKTQM